MKEIENVTLSYRGARTHNINTSGSLEEWKMRVGNELQASVSCHEYFVTRQKHGKMFSVF